MPRNARLVGAPSPRGAEVWLSRRNREGRDRPTHPGETGAPKEVPQARFQGGVYSQTGAPISFSLRSSGISGFVVGLLEWLVPHHNKAHSAAQHTENWKNAFATVGGKCTPRGRKWACCRSPISRPQPRNVPTDRLAFVTVVVAEVTIPPPYGNTHTDHQMRRHPDRI